MVLNDRKVGVRFRAGVTELEKWNVIANEADLASFGNREGNPFLERERIAILPAAGRARLRNAAGTIARLNARAEVAYAAPVYQKVPGFDAMLSDVFFVSFPAEIGRDKVAVLHEKYGAEVVDVFDFPGCSEVGYLLRTTKAAGKNALELANLYYDEPLVASAGPEFYPLYPILADDPFPEGDPDDPHYDPDGDMHLGYHLVMTRVREVWKHWPSWRGAIGDEDIVIAIVDAGVDLDHPDLAGKLWEHPEYEGVHGYDFIDDDFTPDTLGGDKIVLPHGTKCAGVAGAMTNNVVKVEEQYVPVGVAGVAGGGHQPGGDPEARTTGCPIMSIRAVYDGYGWGVPVAYGLLWASGVRMMNNSYSGFGRDNGADVISMSLVDWEPSPYLEHILTELDNFYGGSRPMLVAAAGNFDQPYLSYPAAYPQVMAVGGVSRSVEELDEEDEGTGEVASALDYDGANRRRLRKWGKNTGWPEGYPAVSPFPTDYGSDFGPELDIVAPCEYIATTTDPGTGEAAISADEAYRRMNRTSSATPQVAGAAALMLSANPDLTVHEVRGILQFTALDLFYRRNWGWSAVELAQAGHDWFTGHGLLDAEKAVEWATPGRTTYRNYDGETRILLQSGSPHRPVEQYEIDPECILDGSPFDLSHLDEENEYHDHYRKGGKTENGRADGLMVAAAVLPTRSQYFLDCRADDPGAPLVVQNDDQQVVAVFTHYGVVCLAGVFNQWPWPGAVKWDPATRTPAATYTEFPSATAMPGLLNWAGGGRGRFAFIDGDGNMFIRGALFEYGRERMGTLEETTLWHEDFEYEYFNFGSSGWDVSEDEWTHQEIEDTDHYCMRGTSDDAIPAIEHAANPLAETMDDRVRVNFDYRFPQPEEGPVAHRAVVSLLRESEDGDPYPYITLTHIEEHVRVAVHMDDEGYGMSEPLWFGDFYMIDLRHERNPDHWHECYLTIEEHQTFPGSDGHDTRLWWRHRLDHVFECDGLFPLASGSDIFAPEDLDRVEFRGIGPARKKIFNGGVATFEIGESMLESAGGLWMILDKSKDEDEAIVAPENYEVDYDNDTVTWVGAGSGWGTSEDQFEVYYAYEEQCHASPDNDGEGQGGVDFDDIWVRTMYRYPW